MTDTTAPPLLASFEGRSPVHPPWFAAAIADAPQRRWHEVAGTPIEMLTWGEVGRPGLLLLHGKMAHADWWSFIAPFFAATHRVAALSFAGMGASGWRDAYSVETMADEVMAVARRIADNAPISVRQAKKAIDKATELDRHSGYAFEIEAYNRTVGTEDRQEGINAFNEKRKPRYKGR